MDNFYNVRSVARALDCSCLGRDIQKSRASDDSCNPSPDRDLEVTGP